MAIKQFDTQIKVHWNDRTDDGTPLQSGDKLEEIVAKLNNNKASKSTVDGLQNSLNDLNATASEAVIKARSLINIMGSANGIATLDSTGKVPSSQLPSFVDDVIEGYYSDSKFYSTKSGSTYSGEITGETGKIYTDLNTDTTYRWSGTVYTQIKGDLALGETDSTAYRGDRGKVAYDHSQTAHAPANAEKNTVVSIKKNGTAITPDANRAVDISVPVKTSELANDSGFITEHPDVSVGDERTTSQSLSWGSSFAAYVSVGVDKYGHATSRVKNNYKLPDNPVPSNVAKSYKAVNHALTVSGGLCTWTVTHNLNDLSPIVSLYEDATNEQVMADIIVIDDNTLKVVMCSSTAIEAGKYGIKVIV